MWHEPRTMNTQVSSTDQEGHEQEQNQKVGQRAFDLIQDLQKPENMKELKGMLKNRAWEDTPTPISTGRSVTSRSQVTKATCKSLFSLSAHMLANLSQFLL